MVGTTVWLGARRTLLLPAAWRPGRPLAPAAMMLCTRFQLRNGATHTTAELINTAVLVEKAYAELQLKNIQHQVPIVAVPPPSSSSSSSSSSSPSANPCIKRTGIDIHFQKQARKQALPSLRFLFLLVMRACFVLVSGFGRKLDGADDDDALEKHRWVVCGFGSM